MDAHAQAVSGVPAGYLPAPLDTPAAWQPPVGQEGGEAAATQLDPVAWVGNVALALPEYETTPIAFVFDPQHEGAAPAFYGAAPPAGWQGLLRTALFAPDPDAANGQGFGQALYLKGHWFDSDVNARAWYLAGKPLLEASGNGRYVDQTGEAGFGIQRTVWGTSFPTPDNPDVTLQRAIAWVRRANVVVEATLDAYCAGSAGTGTFCADGVVPYLVEELGPLLDDKLTAAETGGTLTRNLPVLEGTDVVQVEVTQLGDQTIKTFGQTPEQRERREAFGFGASAHLSGQYVGADADGNPLAVFTNSWITDSFVETQEIREELVRFIEESDERIGAERTEIPRLALSGEGWAVTANAFTFPQPDGTTVGGVEVRAAKDAVVSTAAVVTPLTPETTPQDVADEFERQVDSAPDCPAGPGGPTGPEPTPRHVALAILLKGASASLGVTPRDILDAFATEDDEEAVELVEEALNRLVELPENLEDFAPPKPSFVGEWLDEAAVYC